MNFDEISHELYAAELSANPAELHGVICGCICGGQTLQPDQLYQLVCSLLDTVAEQIEPLEETLLSLYDYSVGQVRSGGFVFQPLLPDDEMVIEQRVMALGEWCQAQSVAQRRPITTHQEPRSENAESEKQPLLEQDHPDVLAQLQVSQRFQAAERQRSDAETYQIAAQHGGEGMDVVVRVQLRHPSQQLPG